jgi:formylglycine-generating enzyme required for sulfatase activity
MLIGLKLKGAAMGVALVGPLLATTLAPLAKPPAVEGFVRLPPAAFAYRVAGDFSRDGKPVANPQRELMLSQQLTIMKNQVTAAEYSKCVADGACPRASAPNGSPDAPIVGVSWHDATAYAMWISRKTGVRYRLPTDEEWSFAAAEKARDEARPLVDPGDPAQAWIARYEAEASRGRPSTAKPQPAGAFGTNSNGLADVAGNVWEWTETCFVRATFDGGKERVTNTNCGVRVVQGAHRTYMTDFIRDPRTGGCAAGVPPANLGFRLVIEPSQSVVDVLRKVTRILARA